MLSSLRLECKQKNFQIHFEFSLFSLTHLELKYVHTLRSSKVGKVYTRFQTKTVQKPYPMGRHIPIWFKKGVPPLWEET